jgi:hypothetical protein
MPKIYCYHSYLLKSLHTNQGSKDAAIGDESEKKGVNASPGYPCRVRAEHMACLILARCRYVLIAK